ncbi:hypothetical protein [Jeotgalibacillus haloalkalitolerans]|nr:hypothetical protein [Jeotgalibacillus sp. HH7-29]
MKKDYINFLEKHLGKIQHGWDSDQGNYQIARFNHVPHDGAITFTTVGLNRCVQIDETAGTKLSQELVFISDESFGEQNIPSIMMQIAEMIIDTGNILLQGELIGPLR